MLSFDEARARLLTEVMRVGPERIPLGAASGRVLAAELRAAMPLPLYAFSAMDGYAVALSDFEGEGPFTLRLGATGQAGRPAPILERGCACRIFTGAPIPQGADAVVMQERVQASEGGLHFDVKPNAGAHIRKAGEDLVEGALAIDVGTRLHSGHLALAAMLGEAALQVARRPVVTILCTGDELRAAGARLADAQIFESNSAALGALAEQAGASVRVAPLVHDDATAIERAITQAFQASDLLVTVGGVSVGDHDLVRPALARAGVSLDFWKVAIKPGKPLAVGRSDRAHVLGLPGNPASALVTFALFGIPLLRAMQADAHPVAAPLSARLTSAVSHSQGRIEFARAQLAVLEGELHATVHANQSSGAATSMAWCNGLAVLPAELEHLTAGSRVDAWRFSDF